jgi:hypothetical protein
MTAPTITPLITADERERWQLGPHNVPIGSEEREHWQRDPDRYFAMERLHDAHDQLVEALWNRINTAGLDARTEERVAARAHLERAERKWAAALARFDDRQEGGE